MEKFVYIMTHKRSQTVPELYHISSTYDEAIRVFYQFHLADCSDFLTDNRSYWFMELYKFPVDHDYTNGKITSTKEKLSKSSKHRIKFKDWNALKKEYKRINRDIQIANIVD